MTDINGTELKVGDNLSYLYSPNIPNYYIAFINQYNTAVFQIYLNYYLKDHMYYALDVNTSFCTQKQIMNLKLIKTEEII